MVLQLVDEDEFAKLCKVKQNGPMIHQLLTIDNLRLQISRGSLFFILIPDSLSVENHIVHLTPTGNVLVSYRTPKKALRRFLLLTALFFDFCITVVMSTNKSQKRTHCHI